MEVVTSNPADAWLADIAAGFEARAPWITGFDIGGKRFGGSYHAATDPRLVSFLKRFHSPGRVLELGSLEGGHTFPLAQAANEVIAVEARPTNLEKSCWLQSIFGAQNVRFMQRDIESVELSDLGSFDVIFNLGLLYHLAHPWELLSQLSTRTRWMYLWTHVAPPRWRRSRHPRAIRQSYRGVVYPEHGANDPLSGLGAYSFWPTEKDLLRMLGDCGFIHCELLRRERGHIHGPAVLMLCGT